jgi:hypothetical protein
MIKKSIIALVILGLYTNTHTSPLDYIKDAATLMRNKWVNTASLEAGKQWISAHATPKNIQLGLATAMLCTLATRAASGSTTSSIKDVGSHIGGIASSGFSVAKSGYLVGSSALKLAGSVCSLAQSALSCGTSAWLLAASGIEYGWSWIGSGFSALCGSTQPSNNNNEARHNN